MCILIFLCSSDGIVAMENNLMDMPPIDASFETVESWRMTFDNYKTMFSNDEKYRNLSRDVSIVRTNTVAFIKGIFNDYPNSWIEGTLNGKTITFEPHQHFANDNGKPVYFQCGVAVDEGRGTNTSIITEYCFSFFGAIPFDISDDGKSITSDWYYYSSPAFWYSYEPEGDFSPYSVTSFDYNYNVTDQYEYAPEMDFIHNIKFERLDSGLISDIYETKDKIDKDKIDKSMYDLQGRKVDPSTAHPGIYIQAGRKIIIH